MRLIGAIAGALALARVVIAVPHVPVVEDTCIPSISTMFATPSAIYHTVTVHDAISTVYVTVPSISRVKISELPTNTYTLIGTSTATTTAPQVNIVTSGGGKLVSSGPSVSDYTITETKMITVLVGVSSLPASEGPLSFYVVDGTTSWLGGKTPVSNQPIVYTQNVVTVVPQPERTTTLKSTVKLTTEVTITHTLPPLKTPGGLFTSGGWNVSTVAAGVAQSGFLTIGTNPTRSSKPTLVTDEPTFDLYPTTLRSGISISSYAALSGFSGYTTLTAPSVTSPSGGSTTAVVQGQTYSWTAPTSSSKVPSLTLPPYGNATYATSGSITVPTSSTSATLISSEAVNSTSVLSSISTSTSASSENKTATVSSAASATPSSCGITGDFVLAFDDIPPLSIGNQSIDDVAPMPVFNPYQKFAFSKGFVVVPPPRVPYLPSSKPLLLEFIPDFTVNRTDGGDGPNSRELGWSGDIGNADHGRTGCFSFNVYGASFGCDSRGPDCVFSFSGFRYNQATKLNNQVTTQTIPVAPCPKLSECPLTSITLDNTFQNLDLLRINVTVAGLPKLWWVDDVRLGWTDNSCTKGLCRQTTKIR